MVQPQYMAQLKKDDDGSLMVAQGLEKRKLSGDKGGLLKDGKSQKVGVFMLKIQGILLLNCPWRRHGQLLVRTTNAVGCPREREKMNRNFAWGSTRRQRARRYVCKNIRLKHEKLL